MNSCISVLTFIILRAENPDALASGINAADGTLINADVNGAYNIMRKGKQNFRKEELSSGLLESPVRIIVQ